MDIEKSQTLSRVVKILDCFLPEMGELGVREVARKINLSSSATGRLMLALKELGILNQNHTNKAYSMGSRPLVWAGVYLTNLDVRSAALPYLENLHRTTQETISLYVLDGDERICVERIESPQNVRIVARIGRRLPLYAGSAGKIFLAFLPETRRETILSSIDLIPFTENTITNKDILRTEIESIRKHGFATSHGEWMAEASGIAAPIFDQKGEILAVITVSGPSQRFTAQEMEKCKPALLEASSSISAALGYHGAAFLVNLGVES